MYNIVRMNRLAPVSFMKKRNFLLQIGFVIQTTYELNVLGIRYSISIDWFYCWRKKKIIFVYGFVVINDSLFMDKYFSMVLYNQ